VGRQRTAAAQARTPGQFIPCQNKEFASVHYKKLKTLFPEMEFEPFPDASKYYCIKKITPKHIEAFRAISTISITLLPHILINIKFDLNVDSYYNDVSDFLVERLQESVAVLAGVLGTSDHGLRFTEADDVAS
jgi:hypothetical protein